MTADEPRMTVVIPTRDRASMLEHAIISVLASPLVRGPQSVIVVDDGSTDGTADVIASSGVEHVRLTGDGPGAARNAGLRLVTTEFVAFLDDDDVWLPGNMSEQVTALDSSPSAAFAFGRVQRTDHELQPFGDPFPAASVLPQDMHAFVYGAHLQLGAILFRTNLVKRAGGFDESLRYTDDSHLMVRLAADHPVCAVDGVGSLFRQRPATAQEAETRWKTHQCRIRSERKLRLIGALPSFRRRIGADLRLRGLMAYYFVEDARRAVRSAQRRDAIRYLGYAIRVSPAHCALKVSFWQTVVSMAVNRPRISNSDGL